MTRNRPPDLETSLERTRSAVLNVLIVVGLGILGGGLWLGPRQRGAWDRPPEQASLAAYLVLIALLVLSVAVRRVYASRSALRDPATRDARLFRGHLTSAVIGALAMPLGIAYGWAIEPRLGAVAPFWVAALGLGFLALPRRHDLEDLDDDNDRFAAPQPPEPSP